MTKPSASSLALKRKIGYNEDNSKVALTTRKMRKLSIHSEAGKVAIGEMDTTS